MVLLGIVTEHKYLRDYSVVGNECFVLVKCQSLISSRRQGLNYRVDFSSSCQDEAVKADQAVKHITRMIRISSDKKKVHSF